MTGNGEPALVYIMDDDESARRGLARLVRSAEIEVQTFASAREFLDSPHRIERACVVADVMMTGMSGVDMCRELSGADAALPVIFVTAYDTPETRQAAKEVGAAGYFRKPVDGYALLDAIRWALSSKGS